MGRYVLGTLTFASILACALAAAAQARPPEVENFTDTFAAEQGCDGFTDEFSGSVNVRSTTFFNASGDAVRVRSHIRVRETDTNSVTGKTIAVRQNYSSIEDLATGTIADNGAVFISTSPGEGVVIQDTGKVVFDSHDDVVKVAGPHQVLETGGEIFCTALS
jgi:hypothetical protein